MSSLFESVPDADILRFVAANPLGWIVPAADPSAAILMPVLMETGADGRPASLLGHLPRRGAITPLLEEDPRATCLFLGPNAYIPPGWVSKPGWAPTWNFVSLKVTGRLSPDASLTEEAVRRLVDHMERPAGSDWSVAEMGERFEKLLHGIIGFRMDDITLTPRFKTGQDETDASRSEIFNALSGHPLQAWMG